jgi:hypothetical protein
MGGEKKAEYDKFWGGQKVKEDRFKIVDERQLEQKIKEKQPQALFFLILCWFIKRLIDLKILVFIRLYVICCSFDYS